MIPALNRSLSRSQSGCNSPATLEECTPEEYKALKSDVALLEELLSESADALHELDEKVSH